MKLYLQLCILCISIFFNNSYQRKNEIGKEKSTAHLCTILPKLYIVLRLFEQAIIPYSTQNAGALRGNDTTCYLHLRIQ